jgi:pyruvate dehydrogenase (quinone)
MPPRIEAEQVRGFTVQAIKAVLSGRAARLVDLARTKLLR